MHQINSREWDSVRQAYEALGAEPLTPDSVQGWLQRWSELEARVQEDVGNAASRSHENTADADAEALYLHYVREIMPKVEVEHERLKQKLMGLEGYEPPAEQQTMMREFRTEQRLFRAENVQLKTEVSLLVNEHRKVTGQMSIEWEGRR